MYKSQIHYSSICGLNQYVSMMYLKHYIISMQLIFSTVIKNLSFLVFNKRKNDILIDISIMVVFEYNNIHY